MSNRSALTELVSRAGMIGWLAVQGAVLTRVHASYTPSNGFAVLLWCVFDLRASQRRTGGHAAHALPIV